MNGVMEMASEVRKTLILCQPGFMAAPISSAGSAVASTYSLQPDFWTGMISGMRVSRTDRDLGTRLSRYAESRGQNLPGLPRS
jgi:hypothetical protein